MSDYEKTARELLPCTCEPHLPKKMREAGDHFCGCPLGECLVDVTDALEQVELETRRKVYEEADEKRVAFVDGKLVPYFVTLKDLRRICGMEKDDDRPTDKDIAGSSMTDRDDLSVT